MANCQIIEINISWARWHSFSAIGLSVGNILLSPIRFYHFIHVRIPVRWRSLRSNILPCSGYSSGVPIYFRKKLNLFHVLNILHQICLYFVRHVCALCTNSFYKIAKICINCNKSDFFLSCKVRQWKNMSSGHLKFWNSRSRSKNWRNILPFKHFSRISDPRVALIQYTFSCYVTFQNNSFTYYIFIMHIVFMKGLIILS